ncbi:hypothetical protein [Adlercreutzia sp. ZJ304]|uniref:hypothetical protein n=1 Tax=Adlercreutzia sp. ZJ304 TaxID=2709791 RepID=UPI0013EAD17D|nr:hypothetical protein [Adlercreutzia sp. ZJ304]
MTTPDRNNIEQQNPIHTGQVRSYGSKDAAHVASVGSRAHTSHTSNAYASGVRVPGAPAESNQAAVVNRPTQSAKPIKPNKKGTSRGKAFWIAIVVAIVAIVAICALAFVMCSSKGARQGDAGQLSGKSQEEIQAELDRIVEEGMFNISIASFIEFPNGSSEGAVRIENVPNNHYLMRVSIMRDDTGETIYTTDFIEPNHHIENDTLDVDLPAGTYPCTAMFYAYDMNTEELRGQAAAKVTISVLE